MVVDRLVSGLPAGEGDVRSLVGDLQWNETGGGPLHGVRNAERFSAVTARTMSFLKACRRSWREAPRAAALRRTASGLELTPLRPSARLATDDVPLIVPVRNERSRLAPFLAHYRRLGVTRFLVVDDQSDDGTYEYLAEQPDVDLYSSNVRFAEAGHGTQWRYALAKSYGFNRYYLSVDIDEYLVYSGMEEHNIADLITWMQSNRRKRLLAGMIDLYPSGPIENVDFHFQRDPWKVAKYFDRTGYEMHMKAVGPLISGGAMERLFHKSHFLHKFPLLCWTPRTIHHPTIHNPFPYQWSSLPILGCLLHFKLFADLVARSKTAVEEEQYVGKSWKYRDYLDTIKTRGILNGMDERVSLPYSGPDQLVQLGLMSEIDWKTIGSG